MTPTLSTSQLSPVLRLAGVDIRIASTDDHRRIISDWFETMFPRFCHGDVQPFTWLDRSIRQAVLDGNRRLLERIYHGEANRWIHAQLANKPAMVAFDTESPALILGWAHPMLIGGVYVVEQHRSFPELKDALRLACGP